MLIYMKKLFALCLIYFHKSMYSIYLCSFILICCLLGEMGPSLVPYLRLWNSDTYVDLMLQVQTYFLLSFCILYFSSSRLYLCTFMLYFLLWCFYKYSILVSYDFWYIDVGYKSIKTAAFHWHIVYPLQKCNKYLFIPNHMGLTNRNHFAYFGNVYIAPLGSKAHYIHY